MAKELGEPTPLPNEINIATRSLHTELNRLIVARLPLALPPHASDPAPYASGLLHFAHVYLTFESLWHDLCTPAAGDASQSPPMSPLLSFLLVNPYAEPDLFTSTPTPELLEFLQTLRPSGLLRSSRIKKDLEYLTGLPPSDFEVLLAQYPGSRVAEFCKHIRSRVGSKPHVLVAYAWCFYMAIFSGGRWIRSELTQAGEDFWGTEAATEDAKVQRLGSDLTEAGLSLWSFAGDQDGIDIKEDFKMRLLAAETLFTADERIDIIEEAKTIFRSCVDMVHELDDLVGADLVRREQAESVEQPQSQQQRQPSEPDHKAAKTTSSVVDVSLTWVRKPEVTGLIVALGCMACVAFLRLGYDVHV